MNNVVYLFLASLITGQIGGIRFSSGAAIYLHDIVLLLLIVSACLVIFSQRQLRIPTLLPHIVGFVLVGILSLAVNPYRLNLSELMGSSLYLLRWMAYAALYIVVVQRIVRPTVWIRGLFAVGSAMALLGLFQYVLYPDLRNLMYLGWDPHYYRVFSTLLDPNFAGILFVLTFLLGLTLRSQNKYCCWGILLLQGLTLTALILTFSRSSYLAFIAGLFIWAAMKRRMAVVGIVAVICILLYAILPKPGSGYLRLDRIESSIARVGNWQQTLELIRESPLLGHGFNTLRFVQRNRELTTVESRASGGTDSSVLFLFATTGSVGFLVYAWLLLCSFRMALDYEKGKNKGSIGIVYVASSASVLVHSIFSNSLFYPWVMLWIWMLIGSVEIGLKDRKKPERIIISDTSRGAR